MSKFKRWYAAGVVALMIGSFAYLRVTEMLKPPQATETPISRTEIQHVETLKKANPDFYAFAHDGDFENVYADRVELVDGVSGQILASRKKE